MTKYNYNIAIGRSTKAKTRSIAAYSFALNMWLYWNAQTEQFDLLELEPGKLVKVNQTPVTFRKSRNYPLTQGCEWVAKQ
jgi:hypothetical protein